MPFTFAHSAAVLPFPRKRLVFSALVVGSMSPDFYYFLLIPDVQKFGHTLTGLFLFCLPVGFASLWLFHKVFKSPLLSLAPAHLRNRLSKQDLAFHFAGVSRIAWIFASMAIGWVTHVAWDAFTHSDGTFVVESPLLSRQMQFWPHWPLYDTLQMVSSGIGLLLLAWAYWRWARERSPQQASVVPPMSDGARNMIVTAAAFAALVFGTIVGLQFADRYPREWFRVFVVRTIVGCITGVFLEVVAFSLYWHLIKAKPRKPSSGAGLAEPAFQD